MLLECESFGVAEGLRTLVLAPTAQEIFDVAIAQKAGGAKASFIGFRMAKRYRPIRRENPAAAGSQQTTSPANDCKRIKNSSPVASAVSPAALSLWNPAAAPTPCRDS